MAENVNPQQLIDALGRIAEVGPKAGDALEALANAMKGAVTKIAGAKGGSEFVDLIEDKDSKIKKFAEYLKDDVPDAFKELVKEVKKVKEGLEATADALDRIKKNSSGGGAKGTGGGGAGGCPCEQVLGVIETHMGKLAGATSGNGIKLESKVTNLLKMMNNHLKKIASGSGMLGVPSGRGPKRRVRTGGGGGGATGGLDPVGGSGLDPSTSGALGADMETISKEHLKSQMEMNQLHAQEVEFLANEVYWKRRARETSAEEKKILFKINRELAQAVASGGDLEKAYKKAKAQLDEMEAKHHGIAKGIKEIAFSLMSPTFTNFGNKIFGGMISDLNEWEKESTNMAATMTSGIQKAGGEAGKLVNQYRNLLEVSDAIVTDTHQYPGVIRKEWTKAIKKGTRSLLETKAAINSGLAAAWQVGASAESTADEFQKWNMNIGMSATGSVSLARTMSTVAKVTGVMGDHLVQAVAAAREIAQQMKDTGIYSQQTANSIVGWMASAQKFGVDKQVQNIFRASQGGLEAFNEASAQTRNLLASSGQLQNVLGGSADPNDVMKGVGDAIRAAIPASAFSQKDARGKPIGIPDLKKLSKAEISRLDLIMKKRFGMKLGESVRLLEGIQDQNPEDKLKQINDDLKNPRITKAEAEALEMQKKQLEIAIEEKKLTKNLDKLGEASDALKNLPADRMQAAKEADKILQSNKITESSIREGTKLMDDKLKRQGKTFSVMGKNSSEFSAEMSRLLPLVKSGDDNAIKQFREMQMALADANKTADSEAKNNSNNLDKMESDQQRLQNAVQNLAKPLHTMALQAPIWTWYLTMIAGGMWLMYRFWKNGRLAENMQTTANTLVSTLGTKGSGWVHDPYVEHFVQNIDKNIAKLARKMGVADASRARKKKDSTATSIKEGGGMLDAVTDKLSMFSGVLDTVSSGFSSVTGYLGDLFSKKGTLSEGFSKVFGAAKESAVKGFENTKDILTGKMSAKDLFTKGAPESGAMGGLLGKGAEGAESKVADTEAMLAKKEIKTQKREEKLLKRREKRNKTEELLSKKEGTTSIKGKGGAPKAELPKAEMKGNDAIMQGAGKIAAIAAGVVALGVILILAAKAIMALTGFDAKQAQEVAWVLGVVIGAGAFTLFAAAGAAKVMEWANKAIKMENIKDIYMGGLMLMAILPAVILLGLAMILMGALLSYFIAPKKAEELSWAVASILLSAAIVAGAVVLAAASLMVLGLMVPWAWVIIPLMALGAIALFALTPAVMLLALAVIKMSEGLNAMVDVKKAQSVASATASILSSAAIIAGSVLAASVALMLLAPMALLSWIIIPIMFLGATALFALTPAVMFLAMAVIGLANIMNSMVNVESAKKTAAATGDILWAAAKIAAAVVASVATLSALAPMAWFAWAIIPVMFMGAAALFAFTPAVISIATAVIKLSEDMISRIPGGSMASAKKAGEILQSIGNTIEGLAKIMTTMNDKLQPLLGGSGFFGFGPSVIEQLKVAMPILADYFHGISGSLIYGIINPIVDGFPAANKVKGAADSLQGVVKVLDLLPKFIKDLSVKMISLASAKYWNYDLNARTQDFAWWFYGIGHSLNEGIFKPIMTFPQVSEVEMAMQNLEALTDMLEGLMDVMLNLSNILGEIGSIGLDFSALDNVGGIFKGGKLELVINAKEEGGVGGQSDDTSTWMEKMLGVFTGVRSPLVSNNGGLLRGMRSGFGQAIEKPIGGVQKATGRVGFGMNRLSGTMSKFTENTGNTPTAIADMRAELHQDLVNILDKMGDKKEDELPGKSDPAARDWMKENILPHIETFVKAMTAQDAQNVKTSVSDVEFDKQVQAKVEQGRPSGAMMDSMEYLAAIAANTAATNESVQEAVDVLEEIKGLMANTQGGSGEAPNTKANTKPRGTPNYYNWQFGRFGDTSAKQYVNSGV